jgi:hypothetical protein
MDVYLKYLQAKYKILKIIILRLFLYVMDVMAYI